MDLPSIGLLVSLAMTPVCLMFVVWVARLYLTTAISNGMPKRPTEWLMLGIVISFAGSKLPDNFYWFIHWLSFYLDKESTSLLTNYGPLVNVFFRQTLGLLAAMCHVRAAYLAYADVCKDGSKLKSDMVFSFFVSLGLFLAGLAVVYFVIP